MSLSIAGMSWVTPLGSSVDEVWQQLVAGETAPVETLENEKNGARYLVRRVPSSTPFPSHPRLRRASAISRFAAAAGLTALRQRRRHLYTTFLCGYREVRGAICQPDAISRNGL